MKILASTLIAADGRYPALMTGYEVTFKAPVAGQVQQALHTFQFRHTSGVKGRNCPHVVTVKDGAYTVTGS